MKNSSEFAGRLRRLIQRLQRHFGATAAYAPQSPADEIILACLSETTTEAKARQSLQTVKSHFVDYNEMRVCREGELADVLAGQITDAKQAARKILLLLQQIYDRYDSFDPENFQSKNKREIKDLLTGLPDIGPYVAARVMLCICRAHSFPVNDAMVAMLRHEEAIDPGADHSEVQGFLERHISSTVMLKTYAQLRRYSDVYEHEPLTAPKKKTREKASSGGRSRKKSPKSK